MIDGGTITGVVALLGLIGKALNDWVKQQRAAAIEETKRADSLEEKLDARIQREFDRMEAEIAQLRLNQNELRAENITLKARVQLLEEHIKAHEIPLPPTMENPR